MTAKSLKHKFVDAIADGGDATVVRPSNWNDDHDLWLGYRTVSTTSDTIANADHLTLITYSNGGTVTVNCPAPASGNMPSGWTTKLRNIGPGTVNWTGTGGATINIAGIANATYALAQGDTLEVYSQGTTAYFGVIVKSPAAAPTGTVPYTVQRFTSGSGTYTTPAGVKYLELTLVGGGGGGSGGTGNGSAGGSTCWNTSGPACTSPVFSAGGGTGGNASTGFGGTGGTVSGSGTPIDSVDGGSGQGAPTSGAGLNTCGGMGGGSTRGGAGGSKWTAAGYAAAANSGSGGGGGNVTGNGQPGGGAGATCVAIISSPVATYTYAVGTGGGAGSGANVGGAGGAGNITVKEYY